MRKLHSEQIQAPCKRLDGVHELWNFYNQADAKR